MSTADEQTWFHLVEFEVENAGGVDVTGPFAIRVETDNGLSDTFKVVGLASGRVEVFRIFLAGELCYSPDCTVAVVVDVDGVIAESNEANNLDSRTDKG